ncbi:SAM-dependent methyltransferase [Luteimonas dalianensis]|uniref:SAM-dependent methyltransferase n=1 Tax=Luteimonas dalianensis TaxID=1148196 RepID=UPI003BF3FB90
MNAFRSLACLLLVLPLLSACSDDTTVAAEPAFESSAPADGFDTLDPVAAVSGPESPYEADAPPPARTPDVIYVPTPEPVVDAMLELAGVGPDDVLYDLGSGDGRIPVTAAERFGIRAVGIDINPVRIMEANANAEEAGVTDKVTFIEGDLFEAHISDATVVTLYLLQSLNVKLRPKLLSELQPGTRIVSHSFDMANEWEPEQTREVDGSMIYLWTVPER